MDKDFQEKEKKNANLSTLTNFLKHFNNRACTFDQDVISLFISLPIPKFPNPVV